MLVANDAEIPKKDLPLRDDIRPLGRVLGDTIRDQEGEAMFDLVEQTPSITCILFATALSERSCWTLGT
jgi:phosphoenolpyruvate carboxylase